jgi:hypothetical protein
MLAVGLAQGRYKRVAVLAADFAILVAMTESPSCFMMVTSGQLNKCDFHTRR